MSELTQKLLETHTFLAARPSLDWPAVNCPQEQLLKFMRWLRDEQGFQMLCDVTAIDHYETSPRFEVIYHLLDVERSRYVRVATPCAGNEEPQCPSVTDLWPAADWHERETYDMFGIIFSGHPDLRRILMWDGYPYYPLRKEFPLAGHDVELPSEDLVAQTGVTAKPAPMMGGPFHSGQRGPMSQREPRADDESWTESRQRVELDNKDATPREMRESRKK